MTAVYDYMLDPLHLVKACLQSECSCSNRGQQSKGLQLPICALCMYCFSSIHELPINLSLHILLQPGNPLVISAVHTSVPKLLRRTGAVAC